MSKKLTISNIKNFLQAYSRKYYNLLVGLSQHEQEQINYRYYLCKDTCGINKECIKCGCDFPDKLFQIKTCNEDRFPDIMSRVKWEEFKTKNNINA